MSGHTPTSISNANISSYGQIYINLFLPLHIYGQMPIIHLTILNSTSSCSFHSVFSIMWMHLHVCPFMHSTDTVQLERIKSHITKTDHDIESRDSKTLAFDLTKKNQKLFNLCIRCHCIIDWLRRGCNSWYSSPMKHCTVIYLYS